ncbi:MAG TPA: hypothetical protein VJX67_21325 [Blastocatellia bacterium]|nr:hypothetical protein [Blastocatellia bacterium]
MAEIWRHGSLTATAGTVGTAPKALPLSTTLIVLAAFLVAGGLVALICVAPY